MRLQPGDEVLVLADPGLHGKLAAAFEGHLPDRELGAPREGNPLGGPAGLPG
jgi:hypothetical protein